jgi:uncharacterized protein (DUF362 family)
MVNRPITRRQAIAGSLGSLALATACGRARHISLAPANVSIVRAPAYAQALYETVRHVIAHHNPDVRGKRVVLKPNLVEFDPGTSINTHPMMVHAVLEAFRALGAADVRIAEGPGHRRNTLDLADAAGYFQTIPGFENIFVDLKSLYLPNTALGGDLLVSLPKMKTHHWVGATLSMKNFFGLVPGGVYGWPKNVLHWAGINETIADLHSAFPRHFALVDGIVGMEGNGPIQGKSKSVGVIVAGADFVAVDATCCRIMGIDPSQILYLALAGGPTGVAESRIRQTGESIASVRTPFELIPDFQSIRL